MYPLTGNVPPKIKIPQDLLPARAVAAEVPAVVKSEKKSVGVNCVEIERPEMIETSTQTDEIEEMEMLLVEEDNYGEVIAPPAQFSEIEEETPREKPKIKIENVKILNKATPQTSSAKQFRKSSQVKIERVEVIKPTILNTQLQTQNYENVVDASVEQLPDGNIKILTFSEEDGEYLEEAEFVKPDPKYNAEEGVVYTCGVCERSFPLLQQLEIHKINHTRERNHPCDFCEKSFFTKYDLAKHVLTHTKQKDYQCIVCGKSFSRSTLLYRHERIHADLDIPRHPCSECDRVYLNIADYTKHIETHNKNRPYPCRYCDKAFAFKQGLERHEIIHDISKLPNPCQYCELRFPSAARLQRHLSQKHAGMRPFPCSKCSKRFSMSHHLYRHMRTTHGNAEVASYQCPECEEVYSDRVDFFNHAIEHASLTLTCPLCRLLYETVEDVTDHIIVHSKSDMHFCDYCANVYMTAEDLQSHYSEAHSEELCSVGEEIEFIVEDPVQPAPPAKKRKAAEKPKAAPKKKVKEEEEIVRTYGMDENFEEDYSDQFIVSDIDGAAFVEYEEIAAEDYERAKPAPKQKAEAAKTYSRVVKEEKTAPQVRKMSRLEIEQLKKEGKIEILPNGEMRMKT